MQKYRLLFVFLCFCTSNFLVQAQSNESEFTPARPGISPFPAKLDKGLVAIEVGFSSFQERAEAQEDRLIVIPVSLRLGILENLELNMTAAYESLTGDGRSGKSYDEGLGQVSIGGRFKIAEEKGWIPHIEFQGALQLPYFETNIFTPEDIEPRFTFNFLHNLNNNFQLTYGAGLQWQGPDEHGFYGIKLSWLANNELGFYGEQYAILRGNNNGEAHAALGLFVPLRDRFQIDAGLDVGWSSEALLTGFTVGIAALLVR